MQPETVQYNGPSILRFRWFKWRDQRGHYAYTFTSGGVFLDKNWVWE